MKVYLSIPITGYVYGNEPRARLIAEQLTKAGHTVVVPHDVPPYDHGDDPCTDVSPEYPGATISDGRTHAGLCHLRQDLIEMLDCRLVYAAPGWEVSRGCRVEIRTALAVGMRVISWGDNTRIWDVPPLPEIRCPSGL